MSHRGLRRDVAEVLSQDRTGEGVRFYSFRVRLSCGHEARVSAKNRYRKGETPKVGHCRDPQCVMAEVER